MKRPPRVAFCGTHGTGKTTLLSAINHPLLNPLPKITEIARSAIERFGKKPQDMPKNERIKFQNELYTTQLGTEMALKKNGFIADRSMVDVACYTHSIDSDDEEVKKLVALMLSNIRNRYDFVFYLPIEFPLEADGVRFEGEAFREEIDGKIKRALDGMQIPYITLTGSVEERLEKIYKTIDLFYN